MNLRTITGALAVAAMIAAAGCATVEVSTIPYANVPYFAPTDPARVQILRAEPARPNQKLAEITIDATAYQSLTPQQVDEKLRAAAAKLGADAAVIVVDPRGPAGGVATQTWWGTPASAVTGRDAIAVAIKYR